MKFDTVLSIAQKYKPYVLTYRHTLNKEKLNELLKYCRYIDIGDRRIDNKSTIRSIHSASIPPADNKLQRSITKIAVTTENESKLLKLVTRRQQFMGKKIIIGMGIHGRITRLLYRKMGSELMYSYPGTNKDDKTAHIGLYNTNLMKQLYRSDKVTTKTKIFALLGHPINHSIGPLIYNIYFSKYNIDAIYCRIYGSNPNTLFNLLKVFNVKGASITSPLKDKFKNYISSYDHYSNTTGTVNTLLVRDKKKIYGANTDVDAFINILRNAISYYKNPRILILGSGSTCISAITAGKKLDLEIYVSARNNKKLNKLKSELKIKTVSAESLKKISKTFEIILNTTTYAGPNQVVKSVRLSRNTTAIESVYFPSKTPLIAKSIAQNTRYIPGTELFMEQAYGQIKYFLGSKHHENFRKTCRDVIKYYRKWSQLGKDYLGHRELEEILFWKLPRSLRCH